MKRTIRDLVDLEGKKVLLRVDFNVPHDKYGEILDITRIEEEIPTMKYLVEKGAKLIVLSHMGRPDGFDINLSMWPISLILLRYFPGKVEFYQKKVNEDVKKKIDAMANGSILLLENVRFYKGETTNDPELAKEFASLADIFVFDAFATSHRKHASTYGASCLLPNAIGFLVEKEVNALERAIKEPQRPFVAIFGGLKVEDKIKVLNNIVEKADVILIGGGMAYPFLAAKGIGVGISNATSECVTIAKSIIDKAERLGKKLVLPVDHVAVKEGERTSKPFVTKTLSGNMLGKDIGPATIKLFKKEIAKAGQVVWNGPLGQYEEKGFKRGTGEIAIAVANRKCFSVVGGGDSVNAVKSCGLQGKISHISTGGGATMKFLEGTTLPCIEIIQERIL